MERVDCEICGRLLGYKKFDDEEVLCPECFRQRQERAKVEWAKTPLHLKYQFWQQTLDAMSNNEKGLVVRDILSNDIEASVG
jgi:predicted Fe-S protein YdhL (DUF1289 family)